MTVLVVDDDDAFRERLARALRARGLEVQTAVDYDSALGAARATPPDRAVIDLRMPGRSGLELVRDSAVIKVAFVEGKPREFDFAKDRHIAAADVEEYVGRRSVELVRTAQKAAPW